MPNFATNINPAFPEDINARLAIVDEHAQANIAAASTTMHIASINTKLTEIRESTAPARRRYIQLRNLSDKYYAPVATVAPCRKGCAHCCYVAVPLTQTEANIIGEAIGRRARRVPASLLALTKDIGYHNPCPFLLNNVCSIYEHRPHACRTHYNLDIDDLLCRLDGPLNVPVPLANSGPLDLAYMEMIREPIGDIRQFFPPVC